MIILMIIIILINSNLKNKKQNLKPKKLNSLAFLIPARDESKVITSLIESILYQSYKVSSNDIYVIVEDEKDLTVKICNKYNINVIVRKNLDLKTKGYALDEGLKQIKKHYDMYFIIDADNVLDKNFVLEMVKTYEEGYDIGVSYRNTKNGNDSIISACSSLTFSLMNTIFNKEKSNKNKNVTISGTGFYISGEVIEKFNGYPFNSLTEDYELTLYSVLNNLSSTYNENAYFYDEQPIYYKDTINQRTRWIKGYFNVRKKYVPLIRKNLKNNFISKIDAYLGIKPYLLMILDIIFWIRYFIYNKLYFMILILLLIIYLILMFITIITILKDKKINLNRKRKIEAIIFNPFYMISFIEPAFLALFKKNVTWNKVKHSRNIKI